MTTDRIVLASASTARRTLLENAGLQIEVIPADVDEAAIKLAVTGEDTDMQPGDIAMILAQAKAVAISEKEQDAYVIGADQVLVCGGRRYDKPSSMDEARDQLVELRGRPHRLISAVACARAGKIVWSHDDSVHLEVRDFSNEFLGHYMAAVGKDMLTSVGGYKLEGPGIQLFDKIEGDYFTVLGLPMLPLLEFLRGEGVLEK